jgi:biopolymer transport protein ExbB/TolQ
MTDRIRAVIIIILLLAVIMALVTAASFVGCMSSPDRADYSCDECYAAADMLYRMKSAQDKSVVSPLVEACRDALKEIRRVNRLKYCRDNRPEDMTERECRSWINEK